MFSYSEHDGNHLNPVLTIGANFTSSTGTGSAKGSAKGLDIGLTIEYIGTIL